MSAIPYMHDSQVNLMIIIQLLGFVADAQGEYKSRPAIHMDAFRSLCYIIIIIIIICFINIFVRCSLPIPAF